MPHKIGLRELIDSVKRELYQESDSPRLFFVEKVQLDISFSVERDARGGINFHVIELGGGAKVADVHKVSVTLAPLATIEDARARLSEAERYRIAEELEEE